MEKKGIVYTVRVALVGAIFTAGFFCGSITQRNADAENIGSEIMHKAAGSGGLVGTAGQLGTAITDMQQQVNGLQKNLEVLKKIKGSLGGK